MVRETASPAKVGQAFLPAQDARRAQTGMSAPPLKKKPRKSADGGSGLGMRDKKKWVMQDGSRLQPVTDSIRLS